MATGPATTVHGTMTGVIDTARRTGAFTLRESVAGHDISIDERLDGDHGLHAAAAPGGARPR